ncbi:MMPL family transporter [Oerskovia sp. M15]
MAAALHTIDAPEVVVGGELAAEQKFAEIATSDAVMGESVALVVLCVVLVLVLGGLRAGLLPVVAALASIAASLLALSVLAGVVPVSEFAVNVVTLLGLGLAVDYSLLVVVRFREEREASPRRRSRTCSPGRCPPPDGPSSCQVSRWVRRSRVCSCSPTRCSRAWRWVGCSWCCSPRWPD